MKSRHLLNLSVQNAIDCISDNFNLKNFPARACARNFPEKCAVRSPDRRYPADIATVYYQLYYIFRPPLSQHPPSAPRKFLLSDVFNVQKVTFFQFYPTDLVNTKTTIPLRVGEQR